MGWEVCFAGGPIYHQDYTSMLLQYEESVFCHCLVKSLCEKETLESTYGAPLIMTSENLSLHMNFQLWLSGITFKRNTLFGHFQHRFCCPCVLFPFLFLENIFNYLCSFEVVFSSLHKQIIDFCPYFSFQCEVFLC